MTRPPHLGVIVSRFDGWMAEFESHLVGNSWALGRVSEVARQVFGPHFDNQAMQYQELLDAQSGMDVLTPLREKIGKLYMNLNAQARGDAVDCEGDEVGGITKWNRLVDATATIATYAVAQGRWARSEHDRAERLRDLLDEIAAHGALGAGLDQRIKTELAYGVQTADEIRKEIGAQ